MEFKKMYSRTMLFMFIVLFAGLNTFTQAQAIKSKKVIVKEAKAAITQISKQQLKARIDKKENFTLIDVREFSEYSAGHISGAIWIPRGVLEFKIAKMFPNPNADLVLYCKLGGRGALATKTLQEMGYKNVKNLNGGIFGWAKSYSVYSILGKVKIEDHKAKEAKPHGNGLVNGFYK